MPDLSLSDQFLDGSCDILHRHIRVDAVLIEQIDAVRLETLERCVGDFADAFRPAIYSFARHAVLEAELGRDDDLVAHRGECFAEQFLILERTVSFGCVEEGDALLEGCADKFDARVLLYRGSVSEAQSHTAQAYARHFESAFTKFSFFHNLSFPSCLTSPPLLNS